MSNRPPAICLDLDGTLIDIRERYYAIYSRLAQALGCEPTGKLEYWRRRRRGVPADALLAGLDAPARELFSQRWRFSIESPDCLALDTPIAGALDTLEQLSRRYRPVLVTLRRNRNALLEQLRNLGFAGLFAAILSPSTGAGSPESKAFLIRRQSLGAAPAAIIGDSEADIEAAQALGVPSVCVLSGIRDRQFLSALSPNHIIDSVAILPSFLEGANPWDPVAFPGSI